MPEINVSVNGQPIAARVKVLKEGISEETAKNILRGGLDGYDTYGVQLPDGREALILTQSARDLRKRDHVTFNGQPVAIHFVENEINTKSEKHWEEASAGINVLSA